MAGRIDPRTGRFYEERDGAPLQREPSLGERMEAAFGLMPAGQAQYDRRLSHALDFASTLPWDWKREPGYNAMQDPRVRANPAVWEAAHKAANPTQLAAILADFHGDAQIRDFAEKREPTALNMLVAGALQPDILVPMPQVMGMRMGKAFIQSATAGGAIALGGEVLAMQGDMHHTATDASVSVMAGALIAGGMGSVFGQASRMLGVLEENPRLRPGEAEPDTVSPADLRAGNPGRSPDTVAAHADAVRELRADQDEARFLADIEEYRYDYQFRQAERGRLRDVNVRAADEADELADWKERIRNPGQYTDRYEEFPAVRKLAIRQASSALIKAATPQHVYDYAVELGGNLLADGAQIRMRLNEAARTVEVVAPDRAKLTPRQAEIVEFLELLGKADEAGRLGLYKERLKALAGEGSLEMYSAIKARQMSVQDELRDAIGKPRKNDTLPRDRDVKPDDFAARSRTDEVDELTHGRMQSPYRYEKARLGQRKQRVERRLEALRKDIERAEKAAARMADESELADMAERIGSMKTRATKMEDQIQTIDRRREKVDELLQADSDGVEMADATRLEGAGADRIRWSEMPWYLMKNNKLPGTVGAMVRNWADRLAPNPGQRVKGAREGVGTGASVDARKQQHYAAEKAVETSLWRKYMAYAGKELPDEERGLLGASTDVFAEKIKQGARNAAVKATNAVGRRAGVPGMRSYQEAHGVLSADEFFDQVGLAMMHGDRLPEGAERAGEADAVREAAQEVRSFFVDWKDKLTDVGLIRSHQRLLTDLEFQQQALDAAEGEYLAFQQQQGTRGEIHMFMDAARGAYMTRRRMIDVDPEQHPGRWQALQDRLDEHEGVMSRVREEAGPDWKGQLDDMVDSVNSLAAKMAEKEEAVHRANEELSIWEARGDLTEQDWFHIMYRKDLIAQDMDGFVDKLTEWFMQQPMVWSFRDQKMVELNGNPEEVRMRAMEAAQNILESRRGADPEAHQRALDEVRQSISELRAAIDSMETYGKKRGGKVGKFTNGRVPPNPDAPDAPYVPAQARLNDNGTWEIIVDQDYIRREFDAGPESGGLPKGIYEDFESADEVIKWAVSHEVLHTRLPRRRNESTPEYEARVNRVAYRMLTEQAARSSINLSPTSAMLRERMERLEQREWELVNGSDLDLNPMAPSRAMDVPASLVSDYIENDVRRVMRHYTRQVHARYEVAREFGDARMARELYQAEQDVGRRADELIRQGKEDEAKELWAEWGRQKRATADLRDIVLGHYGMPDDPDAMPPRIARLLQQHAHLTLMGMAAFWALGDSAKMAATYGFRPVVKAAIDSLSGDKGFRGAQHEVSLTGIDTDVIFASRLMQMGDLGIERFDGHYVVGSKFNVLERMVGDSANKMFILNGLAGWSDIARRLAGTVAMREMIDNIYKMRDGTATTLDKERLARAGLTPDIMAQVLPQLEKYAHTEGEYRLANTKAWDDPEAAALFRTLLAQDIAQAVVTPGPADKPKSMRTWWGSLIMQYMSFGISMFQRGAMSFLAHRNDPRVWTGMIGMVGMAAMLEEIKRKPWENPDLKNRAFNAIERSSVMGVFFDMNRRMEYLTQGHIGLRPMLGLDSKVYNPNISHTMSGALGPAAGLWSALAWSMTSDEADGYDQARAIRYMLPLANHFAWSEDMATAQRKLAVALNRRGDPADAKRNREAFEEFAQMIIASPAPNLQAVRVYDGVPVSPYQPAGDGFTGFADKVSRLASLNQRMREEEN